MSEMNPNVNDQPKIMKIDFFGEGQNGFHPLDWRFHSIIDHNKFRQLGEIA